MLTTYSGLCIPELTNNFWIILPSLFGILNTAYIKVFMVI